MRDLVDRYDPDQHEQEGDTHNRRLVEELGLRDYLADRYAVAGTPADCVDRLREMRSVREDVGVLLTAHTEETNDTIRRVGEEVLPAVDA